jgi:sRNA-binding regulator protein Hfq
MGDNGGKIKEQSNWGISDVQAFTAWQGQVVDVVLQRGEAVRGALVGYGAYTLTVKAGARIVVISKGAIAYVTMAEAGGVNDAG